MKTPISQRTKKSNEKAFNIHFNANNKPIQMMKLKKDGTPKQKPGPKPKKDKLKVRVIQFYETNADIKKLGGIVKVRKDQKQYFADRLAELKLKKGKV